MGGARAPFAPPARAAPPPPPRARLAAARRRPAPPPAALPLPHAATLLAPADLVPEFPRMGQAVRDWIAADVPQLAGFNGDDLNKILLNDLVSPSSWYTAALALCIVVLFVYARDLDRVAESPAEHAAAEEAAAAEAPAARALRERRRGLWWLAAAAAAALWTTGVAGPGALHI
jgi:hypothetical protein